MLNRQATGDRPIAQDAYLNQSSDCLGSLRLHSDSLPLALTKKKGAYKMQYTLFTDGSCLKNPGGAGGYAAILLPDMSQAVGGDRSTTNNRMEMKAIIEGLKMLPPKSNVLVVSDSQLAINCAARKWKRKKNLDLWSEYDEASAGHDIDFEWVPGHSGHEWNEECDRLAGEAANRYAR